MYNKIRKEYNKIIAAGEAAERKADSDADSLIYKNQDEITDYLDGRFFEFRYHSKNCYVHVYDISNNFNPLCLIIESYNDSNDLYVGIHVTELPIRDFFYDNVFEVDMDYFYSKVNEVFLSKFNRILNL